MKSSLKSSRNLITAQTSGQATVEAVLIVVVLVSIIMFATREFRSRGLIAGLVEGPWSYLDSMAQYGVWGSPKKTKAFNPYTSRRVSSASEAE